MSTREIPREEWMKFFDNFSRKHEGWRVSLEVFGPEIGDQVQERELFLSGVTADFDGRGDKIEIMIGARPGGHLTHIITAPTEVGLSQTDEGADDALRIKSADGATALLHLR